MNCHKIKVGMKIRIMKMDITHQLHNSNEWMKAMVGKKFNVSKIEDAYKKVDGHPYVIKLQPGGSGYIWAPEDLQYIGPPIKMPKSGTFTFDPKNLIV